MSTLGPSLIPLSKLKTMPRLRSNKQYSQVNSYELPEPDEAELSVFLAQPEDPFPLLEGETDPVLALALSEGFAFSETVANVENLDNWQVDYGETGVALSQVTRVGDNLVNLSFTGVLSLGTITIQALKEVLDGELDSQILTIEVLPLGGGE